MDIAGSAFLSLIKRFDGRNVGDVEGGNVGGGGGGFPWDGLFGLFFLLCFPHQL